MCSTFDILIFSFTFSVSSICYYRFERDSRSFRDCMSHLIRRSSGNCYASTFVVKNTWSSSYVSVNGMKRIKCHFETRIWRRNALWYRETDSSIKLIILAWSRKHTPQRLPLAASGEKKLRLPNGTSVLPLSGNPRYVRASVRQKNAFELTLFQLQIWPQRLPLCRWRQSDRTIGKTLLRWRGFF